MQRILGSIVAVTLFAASPVVFAKGPKKLEVEEYVTIDAAPDVVWAKIKNFSGLNAWHPAVEKVEIVEGTDNKPGAVRVLTLKGGGTIKEKLLKYSDREREMKYSILEGVLPVSNYKSEIEVKPGKTQGTTVVEWEGEFKRKDLSDNPKEGADDKAAVDTMTGVYKAGLENLKKLVEGK